MAKKKYPGTLTAKAPSSRDWPKPESGIHNAICIGLIDMGTQTSIYKKVETTRRRIRVVWELYETAFQLNENTDMQPFTIDKEYTLSLHHKASLRKDLDGWRGVKFTNDELAGFEMNSILNRACQLNVVIVETEKGSEYAKVDTVIHMKAADVKKVPTSYNEIQMFSFEDEKMNWKYFESLPKYIQEIINESPQMQKLQESDDEAVPKLADALIPEYDDSNIPVSEEEDESEEVPF